jgi:hypothetical protein
MSVDLGPKFEPSFEGIPPHVSSEDLVLWEEFRRRSSKDYIAFYFDVSLGTGEEPGPGVSENVGKAWQRLTRFRADVVADTGTEWHLIELRPNAGPGAVGSVQTYTTLWTIQPPDARPVVPIIVTDRCSQDIRTVAQLAGVEVRCLHESV